MSKYEVGYKAVIEVDKVFEQDGEKLYRAKGMKSLVFDEKGLDKLKSLSAYTETLKKEAEENYCMGVNAEYEKWKEHLSRIRDVWQNEAWELAKKCMLMTDRERETIFGSGHNALYGVLTYFDYKHAAAKVAEWEKAKEEIKVGDIYKNIAGSCFVICDVNEEDNNAQVLWSSSLSSRKTLDEITRYYTKTGRHIDVDSFLKQIGGEEG